MNRRLFLALYILVTAYFAVPLMAQPDDAFTLRAQQLPAVMRGEIKPEDYFAPAFLEQIPSAQISTLMQQLQEQQGRAVKIEHITMRDVQTGAVDVITEKGTVSFTLTIEATQPNKVIGLLITGVKSRDDSVAKLEGDFRGLPGRSGILVMRVDQLRAPPLLAINANEPFAIGSAFKLWILAEAARSVNTGERRWSDVMPIGPASLPSGITQKWPKGSPTTVHSLAILMISISDNTATDTLLMGLGRRKVDAMVAGTGHSRPAQTTPILSTAEAFAFKTPGNASLRSAYTPLSSAARASFLVRHAPRLNISMVDAATFGSQPLFINEIEWFASPADMGRTLDWFRRSGGQTALAILAINPGLPEGDAARFAYVGFKGGSEPGVVSLNYLIQSKNGAWYVVAASWNNPSTPLDQLRFITLVTRAIALIP